jgi:hypothetical protein
VGRMKIIALAGLAAVIAGAALMLFGGDAASGGTAPGGVLLLAVGSMVSLVSLSNLAGKRFWGKRAPKHRAPTMIALTSGGQFDVSASEVLHSWSTTRDGPRLTCTLRRTRKGTLVVNEPTVSGWNPATRYAFNPRDSYREIAAPQACQLLVDDNELKAAATLFPIDYSRLAPSLREER